MIQMPKVGVKWSRNEKPEVNHWYKVIDDDDYWKIVKDFYSKERNITFYRIVEYYNASSLYVGRTLAQCREIIRDNCYRMVI